MASPFGEHCFQFGILSPSYIVDKRNKLIQARKVENLLTFVMFVEYYSPAQENYFN
jgi:hypothetical protein